LQDEHGSIDERKRDTDNGGEVFGPGLEDVVDMANTTP
jgi:hypothetical protein